MGNSPIDSVPWCPSAERPRLEVVGTDRSLARPFQGWASPGRLALACRDLIPAWLPSVIRA